MEVEPLPLLSPDEAARLTDFARAFKAAARAVMLYPAGHPAIGATLGRIVHLTSAACLQAPLRISVHAGALLVGGRSIPRPDAAVAELAAQLHGHLIGELTVHPGGDLNAWRTFLLLVGRPPDAVREEGGIGRLWTTASGRHVELREIDYAHVLRERTGGLPAEWETVIANCLQGETVELDADTLRTLRDFAGDAERLGDFIAAIETRAEAMGRGVPARTAAVVRMLRAILEAVERRNPEQVDATMTNVASAIGRLSPDVMLALLAERAAVPPADAGPGSASQLIDAVVGQMPDQAIAGFVARHAMAKTSSIDRVAQAFHSLVPDTSHRERLLTLAHDAAASSPFGSLEGFEEAWGQVAEKMLTTYSDEPYVPDDYARELSYARSRAIDVEQTSDDPPERLSSWLETVSTTELRKLDLQLVLDIVRMERDIERWSSFMRPVRGLIDDLALVGDFDAAAELVAALAQEAQSGSDRAQAARLGLGRLVEGPLLLHVVGHLATIDDAHFERVQTMCVALGEALVGPLAEALASETRARTRQRLTAILVGFGSIGRDQVERLKSSPNPAVRRTAVHLLREFGGTEALPELTELLGDNEPQVQREAVRAILNIGTDRAYRVLEQALAGGSDRSREAIMQSLGAVRDERATPLFAYIVRQVDHRGPLSGIYLRAVEALGSLKDPEGVGALREALYRGEWWAPRRTAAIRAAVSDALARIGTSDALHALEEAATSGPRGVRSIARARLAGVARSQGARP
jgi:HEAT repeat protein